MHPLSVVFNYKLKLGGGRMSRVEAGRATPPPPAPLAFLGWATAPCPHPRSGGPAGQVGYMDQQGWVRLDGAGGICTSSGKLLHQLLRSIQDISEHATPIGNQPTSVKSAGRRTGPSSASSRAPSGGARGGGRAQGAPVLR